MQTFRLPKKWNPLRWVIHSCLKYMCFCVCEEEGVRFSPQSPPTICRRWPSRVRWTLPWGMTVRKGNHQNCNRLCVRCRSTCMHLRRATFSLEGRHFFGLRYCSRLFHSKGRLSVGLIVTEQKLMNDSMANSNWQAVYVKHHCLYYPVLNFAVQWINLQ